MSRLLQWVFGMKRPKQVAHITSQLWKGKLCRHHFSRRTWRVVTPLVSLHSALFSSCKAYYNASANHPNLFECPYFCCQNSLAQLLSLNTCLLFKRIIYREKYFHIFISAIALRHELGHFTGDCLDAFIGQVIMRIFKNTWGLEARMTSQENQKKKRKLSGILIGRFLSIWRRVKSRSYHKIDRTSMPL